MTVRAIEKVGAPVTVVVALMTDVLEPLGPLTFYLAAVAALLGLVFLLPAKPVHAVGARLFANYWRAPTLAIIAVSVALLLAANFVTRSAPDGGFLASHVSAVRDFQDQLGVIDARTEELAKTTASIKKDTQAINKKLDNVKKETSADPRKELANLGVTWSTGSFVEALVASDARVVRLFLQGGMSPTVLHNGASAVLYMLQVKLPDPVPMLKLMVDAGFDVNADLFDARILRHYGGLLPPGFESPGLSADYDASQGTFGGPALLWLVIRSSSGITEDWDIETIDFLKSQGADTKLSKRFLDLAGTDYGWNDFPGYQKVRAAIG